MPNIDVTYIFEQALMKPFFALPAFPLAGQLFRLSFLLLLLVCVAPGARSQYRTQAPGELKGAELFTALAGHGEIHIYLNVYYACQTQAPAKEYVSLFEAMGNRLVSVLELTRDTETVQPARSSAPCFAERDNCLKQVRYAAKTNVGLAYMDYAITWGYYCADRGILNLSPDTRPGFALQIQLPNPAIAEPNAMPALNDLPIHQLCNGVATSFELRAADADSDEVTYQLSQPVQAGTTGTAYLYPSGAHPTFEQALKNPVFSGSVLTGHPPLAAVAYATGQSAGQPLPGGSLQLNSKSGHVAIKAGRSGKYLVGITIQEKRKARLLSEHAVVFITEIR